jgi:TolB-like protein
MKNFVSAFTWYALQGVGLPIPDLKKNKNLSGRFIAELQRRGVLRACATYIVLSLLLILLLPYAKSLIELPTWISTVLYAILIAGFPVAIYLAWNYESSPEGFVKTTSLQSWQNPYKVSQRKPLTSNFVIVALILVIIFIYYRFLSNPIEDISTKINHPIIDKSIAVLPFKNLSEDKSNQYFCDGVMEGILNYLSQIKDLRVLSRNSTEKYRETSPSSPQIAEELNVSYLIEASVFKSEDRIRVTAQLIDARNDEHIWSKQYDSEISDIFSVMSNISKAVASEIEVVIAPNVKERIESVPTENIEAYDLYLRAREYHTHRWDTYYMNKSDVSIAIHLYKQSIALDPNLAISYVSLGLAYSDQVGMSNYLKASYNDTLKILVDKALSIDPELAEGYVALSEYYLKNGNIEKSIIHAKRAIELNPNYGDAFNALANGYKAKNDYINAIINYEKVKKQVIGSQNYPLLLRTLGNAYHDISDYYKAESAYLELVKFDPVWGYWWLCHLALTNGEWNKMNNYMDQLCGLDSGLLCQRFLSTRYIHAGEFETALKIFEKSKEDRVERGIFLTDTYRHAYALYKLNRKSEARELCNKQIEICRESIKLKRSLATGITGGAAYYSMAASYVILGEKEKAYQVLHEMEKEAFSGWYTWKIQVDPIFESFWVDDEFKQIIQRQERKYAEIRVKINRLEEQGLL